MNNVDLSELWALDFIDVLAYLHVEDNMLEEELLKHRDRLRAHILKHLQGYDRQESYGMTNDNIRPTQSDEPLPYIAPTIPTEDGYPGLDPPMG